MLLGDSTYSIYLIHGVVLIGLWSKIGSRLFGHGPLELRLIASLVLSIIAAVVYTLAVERPLLRLLAPFRKSASAAARPAAYDAPAGTA